MAWHAAIMGVTGVVGTEFLKILEQRDFPLAGLKALASSRSAGRKLRFRGQELVVEELTDKSFEGVDLVLASAGAEISKRFAPVAVRAGAVVVDNASAFRMDAEVPLVVPEVNRDDIKTHKGIIANPNCSTIIMNVPVWPLHNANPISRIVMSTYQAVSGAGAAAIAELEEGAQFEDAIGMTGEMFGSGDHLQVPYRALVPETLDGVLSSGRCISVDDGLIHAIRVIPPCMMTGQAAGTAAALCAQTDVLPRELDPMLLRQQLAADGAMLP